MNRLFEKGKTNVLLSSKWRFLEGNKRSLASKYDDFRWFFDCTVNLFAGNQKTKIEKNIP